MYATICCACIFNEPNEPNEPDTNSVENDIKELNIPSSIATDLVQVVDTVFCSLDSFTIEWFKIHQSVEYKETDHFISIRSNSNLNLEIVDFEISQSTIEYNNYFSGGDAIPFDYLVCIQTGIYLNHNIQIKDHINSCDLTCYETR